MNTTRHTSHGADAFEETLRRSLGPSALQDPPAPLHAAILRRASSTPQSAPRFRLNLTTVATALALGLLALMAGWLLTSPLGDLGRLLGHPGTSVPRLGAWQGSLALLLGGHGWLELLRSPLTMVVLPILLLPLLYLLQEEGFRG